MKTSIGVSAGEGTIVFFWMNVNVFFLGGGGGCFVFVFFF